MADISETVTIFTRRSAFARPKRDVLRRPRPPHEQGAEAEAQKRTRTWRIVTFSSSLVLRIASFVFLRWIPGHHLVPVVFAATLVYLAGFSRCSKAPPKRTTEDVISDRYTAAYQRLQRNRQRRDTEEFLRWQRDDEGLRRRHGSISGDSSAQESAESPPMSPLKRSLSPLSKPAQSFIALFPTPPRSILSLSSNPSTSPESNVAPAGKSLPYASDQSAAGITETVLTGLPNPASTVWSRVTLFINLLLAIMVFDLVFRAPLLHSSNSLSFARTGYVDERSARVLVREPNAAHMPLSVSYRMTVSTRWSTTDSVTTVNEEHDFTHAFTLMYLKPATQYEYMSSNGHNGTFKTAPKVGHARLTFLTTSCLKARVPYNVFHHPLQMPGLDHLASVLPQLQASFMLFLGDFIYIDVPFRMGWTSKTYRREYRQVYASPSWQPASHSLPWLHVIDDHEIANDWDNGLAAPYPAAIDPFSIYHHSINPPAAAKNESYYTFRYGPASFFLLDTRRHRTPSTPLEATHPNKTILGAQQRRAVLQWLNQAEPSGVKWKIMVSSVPFTRNWRTNAMDTWAGYLSERQVLLEAMWDAAARGFGVVTVSGDRHEFAATRFPAPDGRKLVSGVVDGKSPSAAAAAAAAATTVHARASSKRWRHPLTPDAPLAVYEFSCSPLSMFYLPIRTYREKQGEQSGVGAGGEDQRIAYIAVGNSKFGAIDIGLERDAKGRRRSVLRYRLFVDGRERWTYGVSLDGREGEDVGATVGAGNEPSE